MAQQTFIQRVNELAVASCKYAGKNLDPKKAYVKGVRRHELRDIYELNSNVATLWNTVEGYVSASIRRTFGSENPDLVRELTSKIKENILVVLVDFGPRDDAGGFYPWFKLVVSNIITNKLQERGTQPFVGDVDSDTDKVKVYRRLLRKRNFRGVAKLTEKERRTMVAIETAWQEEFGDDWENVWEEMNRQEERCPSYSAVPSLDVSMDEQSEGKYSISDTYGAESEGVTEFEFWDGIPVRDRMIMQALITAGTIAAAIKKLNDIHHIEITVEQAVAVVKRYI